MINEMTIIGLTCVEEDEFNFKHLTLSAGKS